MDLENCIILLEVFLKFIICVVDNFEKFIRQRPIPGLGTHCAPARTQYADLDFAGSGRESKY